MSNPIICQKCWAEVDVDGATPPTECPRCGHPLGALAPLESGVGMMVPQASQSPSLVPNPTLVQPGMQGRILDRDYTVRGRVVMGMVEEGQTYYWHEFQLVAADGEVLYLEYDEGTWKLMRPFMPRNPVGPEQAENLHPGSSIKLDDNSAVVTQKGSSQIYEAEGDLTFDAVPGERVEYLDAGFGKDLYAVQWSAEEIEFFRGKVLPEREVYEAFGLVNALRELDRAQLKGRSQKVFATVCLLCAIASLVMWGVAQGSGQVVASGTHSLNAVGQEGLRFGPVTLNPAQRIHRMTIYGSMTEASAWVSGVLETPDELELVGTQYDFWDESGYDDGYWHEWELRANSDFLVQEQNPYYVRLYVERDTPNGNYQDVGYELRAGVIYPNYYATFGIVTFVIALLFYILPSKASLKKMVQSAN